MLYRGLAEADLSGEDIVRLIQGGTVVKVHLDRQATNICLPVVGDSGHAVLGLAGSRADHPAPRRRLADLGPGTEPRNPGLP
jgi:hypothetical protein